MQSETAAPPFSEWRLHWPVLVACVAGVVLSTLNSYTLGVMMGPLEQEFGWTRAEISSGPVILAVMALFVAPMVGATMDRVGPRRIGLFGVLFFCGAFALLSTAGPGITSWLMLWAVLSFAAMFILPTIWTAAVSSLFIQNRGFALAITLCGTGIGGTTIPYLTHICIEWLGWRGAYIAIALLGVGIVFPLAFFFLRSARDYDRAEPTGKKRAMPAAVLTDATAREGLRSWRYYKLAAAATLVAIGTGAIITNAVPILVSNDFSRGSAARIAGLIGIGAIIGRLCGGFLLDRMNPNIVAGTSVLMPAVACVLLSIAPGSTEAAMAAFLILGLGVGTELDACAFLTARHFGMLAFGALFGTINGLMIFGNMLAPVIANLVYDLTKTYSVVILALIPVFLVAAFFFYALGHPPHLEEPDGTLEPVAP